MSRQSISLTEPNELWMNGLLESKEYSSKSEIVNDLIRRARETEQEIKLIRARLIEGENSGFTAMSADELRAKIYAPRKV